jgi:hypothetical protein
MCPKGTHHDQVWLSVQVVFFQIPDHVQEWEICFDIGSLQQDGQDMSECDSYVSLPCAGDWYWHISLPGTVRLDRSSVWVDAVTPDGVFSKVCLLFIGMTAVWVDASIPPEWQRTKTYDWFLVIHWDSKNYFLPLRKDSLAQSSWIHFSLRYRVTTFSRRFCGTPSVTNPPAQ